MKYIFFNNKEILLFYDKTLNKWYINDIVNDKNYDLSITDNLSSFLKVFYEDPKIFYDNLLEKAKNESIDENVLKDIPFKRSIIFCIKNKMFFWLNLSLKWLEFIEFDDEFKKTLEKAALDLSISQEIRHKIKKILKN